MLTSKAHYAKKTADLGSRVRRIRRRASSGSDFGGGRVKRANGRREDRKVDMRGRKGHAYSMCVVRKVRTGADNGRCGDF